MEILNELRIRIQALNEYKHRGFVYKIFGMIIVSSLPFIFSLSGDFVFDDSEAIINNKDVSSGPWTNIFSHDFWGQDIKHNSSHKSYRPLTTLSFRLNYHLNSKKWSALSFKATNLLLHILCCFILWQTFNTILKDIGMRKGRKLIEDSAYLATLLFAVHPVHTEAVSGIVGRADLFAAITFFISFLLYKKAMKRDLLAHLLFLYCAVALATASMLFKENGVTVLGFCICYELLKKLKISFGNHNTSFGVHLEVQSVMRIACLLISALFLIFGRWTIMGGTKPKFEPIDNPAAFAEDRFSMLTTFNYIYFLNILLFIWPQWLCYDWSMGCVPLVKRGDYRIIFIFLMYIYLAFILKALLNEKNKASTKRLMAVCIFLAAIPFLPASNIFYPVGFVIAERVLYISSAGYCLFLIIGFQKLLRWERHQTNSNKISVTLFCFLLLIFGLRSWKRSEEWRNETKLFISGRSVCPLNAKVHYNIAKVLNRTSWAIAEYKEAIRLYPEYYQAMNNLANLMKKKRKYREAEKYFRTALEIKRNFPAAWMNLGIVLASTGRSGEAELAYKNALRYRKDYVDCYYNLGNLYIQMNSTGLAVEYWLRAINSNISYVPAWANLLTVLGDIGDYDRARKLIPIALRKAYNSAAVNFAVANIYGKLDEYDISEKLFWRAIRLFGDDVKAVHYGNLGILYHRWKKYDKAEQAYRKSLKIDPRFETSVRNLVNLKRRTTNATNFRIILD